MSHDAPLTFYSDVTVAYGTKNPAQLAGKKDQVQQIMLFGHLIQLDNVFFFLLLNLFTG